MPSYLILFLIAGIFAECVGTIAGFGASTILVPLTSLFIPIKETIVLVGVFHMFGTLARTVAFRGGINWRIALLFGVPSLIFSIIGAYFLSYISGEALQKILGVALIVYAINSLLKNGIKLPKKDWVLVFGGTTVGFLAGLIGTAGALRGAFLTAQKLKKEVYLGTGAIVGVGADVARVIVYKNTGLINYSSQTMVLLLVTAVFGTIIGSFVVSRFKEGVFMKFVMVALLIAGVRILLP
ncbi:MAG TPA: sulfite exporter TauE/SafE family protein [Patescibacteria group bacterium]